MRNSLYKFIGPGILIFFWWLVTSTGLIGSLYLPNPIQVFNLLVSFLIGGGIRDILATFLRSLASFALASVIAVPLGLFIGMNEKVYLAVEFLIDFFRSFPATALIPLFLFSFGLGNATKIALTAFVSFWIILVYSLYGAQHVSTIRLKVAQVFRASGLQTIGRIVFLDALPEIFVGFRIAFSLSLVMIIVTEMMMGCRWGIGREIYESFLAYKIDKLYSAIAVAGLMGYSLNKILLMMEKKVVHWSNS